MNDKREIMTRLTCASIMAGSQNVESIEVAADAIIDTTPDDEPKPEPERPPYQHEGTMLFSEPTPAPLDADVESAIRWMMDKEYQETGHKRRSATLRAALAKAMVPKELIESHISKWRKSTGAKRNIHANATASIVTDWLDSIEREEE